MEADDFGRLAHGDIIKHVSGGRSFIVSANYGARVTAVTTVDATNPAEWKLVRKANYTER